MERAAYATYGLRIDLATENVNAIAFEIARREGEIAAAEGEAREKILGLFRRMMRCGSERYLNALEALCDAVNRGWVSFEIVHADYGTVIMQAVNAYTEELADGNWKPLEAMAERICEHRASINLPTDSDDATAKGV